MKRTIKTLTLPSKYDVLLVVMVILFSVFGLIMIYEASNVAAYHDFSDKYHYVREQSMWLIIAIVSMLLGSKIPYKKYYYASVPLLIVTIILLIAVFLPGIGIKAQGAQRWISIAGLNFQPSELAKLSVILYLSSWLSSREKGRLTAFILLLSLILGLIILQPDLGTAIILGTVFFIIYFLSGSPLWHFFMLTPAAILSILLLALKSPYRYARLTAFLNPDNDPLGVSYHIRQILISFGSGGFWGVGLGASRQKYQFLPEATTDSIFAIIGEELGFIGAGFVILAFFFFLFRIFKIVKNSPDKFSFLLGGGIFAYFGCQILINLGSMVALFPLTGVPLPFISYGGSNLIISMYAVGILLNISKK